MEAIACALGMLAAWLLVQTVRDAKSEPPKGKVIPGIRPRGVRPGRDLPDWKEQGK